MEHRKLLATLAGVTLLAVAPSHALSQQGQQHEMHGAGGAVAQLQLKDSRKWQTDAALRSGMANIRAAFDADHPAIHAGKQTDAQYAALATRINQQVKSIVANCRLPADADTNLHLIIADLLQGVSLMRGEDTSRSRHDGAALVHGALNAYGQYFDDPAWKPDVAMHEK
ncbi:MAG: hypothetical protein WBM03_12880 [Steroidobacteraceae bacterium]